VLNISTRERVGTGDDVLIGGFIVTGTGPKTVVVRGIGPSLANNNVADVLADPVLELRALHGVLIGSNDNWKDNQQAEIEATQLAPENDLESAIVATLEPGPYTAIVRGRGETTGVGLVEIYDVEPSSGSELGNISTRGFVQTDDNVMIGGFTLGATNGPTNVVVRAIGPSLAERGILDTLADPTLDLRDENGDRISFNDNWEDDAVQAAKVIAADLAPKNPLESAVATTLPAGRYTAIVAGKSGGTGVGLVEVYNVK
jgi:hypothetical protein